MNLKDVKLVVERMVMFTKLCKSLGKINRVIFVDKRDVFEGQYRNLNTHWFSILCVRHLRHTLDAQINRLYGTGFYSLSHVCNALHNTVRSCTNNVSVSCDQN